MQRYIQQLIEVLREVGFNSTSSNSIDDSFENFKQTMFRLENGIDNTQASEEVVGVSYLELPPVDKMTNIQANNLLDAILFALKSKGVEVVFPCKNVNVSLAYTELRKEFKSGIPHKGWTIDFCDGSCKFCAFDDCCESNKF